MPDDSGASHLHPRSALRIFTAHAAAQLLSNGRLEIPRQFLIDLAVSLLSAEKRPRSVHKAAQYRHRTLRQAFLLIT
jgi:hypothetical protein